MINRIEGILESVEETAALVVVGDIAYEVAVPAADIPELYSRIGSRITFHTLHYLESQGQGSSFWPKLIGFQSSKDRAFFELITTVKGIGVRRALRALTIPFARV
ncbi:MAG: OB-fold domain-containing protein, partial [Planctomycetota bacterium]